MQLLPIILGLAARISAIDIHLRRIGCGLASPAETWKCTNAAPRVSIPLDKYSLQLCIF